MGLPRVLTWPEGSFALAVTGGTGAHEAIALPKAAGVPIDPESILRAAGGAPCAHLSQVTLVFHRPAHRARLLVLREGEKNVTLSTQLLHTAQKHPAEGWDRQGNLFLTAPAG